VTTRFSSIDVLRTIAIIVMVLVHFTENLAGYTPGIAGLGAPLFVFLSGASYFLWSDAKLARGTDAQDVSKVSVRRGLFVFGAGIAFNVLVWLPEDVFNWDVLTFIGSALLVLNVLRRVPHPICVLVACMVVLISPALQNMADYAAFWEQGHFDYDWTLSDVLIGYLATGYFPMFPWIALSIAGYLCASRLFAPEGTDRDRARTATRVALLGLSLAAASAALLIARHSMSGTGVSRFLGGWDLYPPSTEYVLGTLGMAIALFAAGHRVLDLRPVPRRWNGLLATAESFSRYSLTIYVLHHIVHIWPLWMYGFAQTGDPTAYWQDAMPLGMACALATIFLAACWLVFHKFGGRRIWGLERCMRWVCD
jgi:uncharacterized membrane protein